MPEKVPRLLAHVDVRSFKLDPMDGFLLTRIDGRLGPKDLARETGLPDFSVVRALEKLEKLGIIEIVEPGAPPRAPPPPKDAPPAKPQLPQFSDALSGPRYDPKELEEAVDLSAETKKRILDLFYRLDDLDHYTLLGLTNAKEADKKTIKRAYFELAATMHPDKYFKKNLGSFKAKMEALFGRVTEAHDTLVDPARRADYDAYLAEVATTRGMEAMLERALEEARRNEVPPPSSNGMAAPPSIPTPVPSSPPPPSGPSAEEIQARKEALARRLLGGTMRPRAPSQPSTPPNPLRYSSPGDAMDALKRRYEARIESATLAQAKKYAQAGEEALSKNDVVAAASAFAIAVKFAPEDVELAMRHQEVKNRAEGQLTESYTKQATYEERNGHFTDAARSWQKVAKLQPNDPRAHDRSAFCMLHVEGADLHQAAEHAKKAVALGPGVIGYHVTLAETYAKAGLTASAKRAAEVGLQLDPANKALLAIAKRTK